MGGGDGWQVWVTGEGYAVFRDILEGMKQTFDFYIWRSDSESPTEQLEGGIQIKEEPQDEMDAETDEGS